MSKLKDLFPRAPAAPLLPAKLHELLGMALRDIALLRESRGVRPDMSCYLRVDDNGQLCACCLAGAVMMRLLPRECETLPREDFTAALRGLSPYGLANDNVILNVDAIALHALDDLREGSWHRAFNAMRYTLAQLEQLLVREGMLELQERLQEVDADMWADRTRLREANVSNLSTEWWNDMHTLHTALEEENL